MSASEHTTTRVSYDRVATAYADALAAELDGKALDRALLAALADLAGGGVIADLGCGPAHVAAYLARVGLPVIGVDLSPQMCALGLHRAGVPCAAGDLTALPLRSGSIAAIVCWYAVIHLDEADRARAYAEFARVLAPGGVASIAFHVRDADTASGSGKQTSEFFGEPVELTFHFLDPRIETDLLADAGLSVLARLDRAPLPEAEHPSERSYLLVRAGDRS